MAAEFAGDKPIVLIVEEDVFVRMSAEDIIEEAGFGVLSTSDADKAIGLLESRNDIGAVFTDTQVPDLCDCLRLVRSVRNRWPPVALLVTSSRNFPSGDFPCGAQFLVKPYQPAQVDSALQALIF